jgi:hypothetical protein
MVELAADTISAMASGMLFFVPGLNLHHYGPLPGASHSPLVLLELLALECQLTQEWVSTRSFLAWILFLSHLHTSQLTEAK